MKSREMFSGPVAGVLTGDDEGELRRVVAGMIEEGKAKRARWPEDGRQAMTALANLFPSMRGAPGTDPWNAMALIEWCRGPAPTSGSNAAARFLLSVWNPETDWTEYGLPAPGKFEVCREWGVLDDAHRAAVFAWLEAPFWP